MPKLKQMAPRLASLPPRLKRQADAEGHDAKAEPWRKWYSLKRWAELRLRVFTRDLFTCQWQGCGFASANPSDLVADHVVPHRGDERLFWAEDNVQTLCTTCHNRLKQAEERAARATGGWVNL